MKAITHDRYGDADVLEFRDVDPPVVGPEDVLIGVSAASVNPLDWHMMTGTPYLLRLVAGLRRPKRTVRGIDVAGRVEAVGADVTDFEPGDRVFGAARGSFAEHAIASPRSIVHTPAELTDAEAAALPIAAITALQALRDHARVQPGDSVLINGAAGGIGTAMVQLAVAMGAEVTAVCSTGNVEMVRSLGAHRLVDYTTEDFLAGCAEYDAIVDNVGNRPLVDCRRALTDRGVYVMVSGPKDGKLIGPYRRMIAGRVRFLFGSRRFANFTASEDADELRALVRYVEAGRLRAVIDRHYPLADTAEAVRYVATTHARAKVIIDVADAGASGR